MMKMWVEYKNENWVKFGSQIWESNLGVKLGSQIWESNLGVKFGGQIWESNLECVLDGPISYYLSLQKK